MKSLEDLQNEQKDLLKDIEHPRIGNILGLFEEVGELSKEVMEIIILRDIQFLKWIIIK